MIIGHHLLIISAVRAPNSVRMKYRSSCSRNIDSIPPLDTGRRMDDFSSVERMEEH